MSEVEEGAGESATYGAARAPLKLPRIYPITDVGLSGLSHAEQVARLCEGGATFVQLREKHATPREFYREAESALRVARERGARLIINDRADIALALGADGVHLGQDDLDPVAARRLLDEQFIIGYSTHNLEQARAAARLSVVDYLALGPVFATSTKQNPDPVAGLDTLRRARAEVQALPLVAIGGIDPARARDALAAGADSLAVIAALYAGGPAEIARRTAALVAAAQI